MDINCGSYAAPNTSNSISKFIRKNFAGATVTVTTVSGATITGEVVDGFDNVIGLKTGTTITFVNAMFIEFFV